MSKKDNKKALQVEKQKLLESIKYYESRIEEFHANASKNNYFDVEDSSDSECDFPVNIDAGPSVLQLKLQESALRTCAQATQELTSLLVLQSQVDVLTEDPVFENEPSVTEPGCWREVTAECRIDTIPFTITFYTHQPTRQFAPISYRSLRCVPVKAAHEAELDHSALQALTRPSDAVEVIRSYAVAYRSRRGSLARLADKYANSLFMEPMAEGGYRLRCGALLELSWRIEQRAPLAPFQHKMKFDLDYMDEAYIKIISAAHKQLSYPEVETIERTMLLSKIIATCLEAQGPQELSESQESEVESVKKLDKRRTTLDHDEEAPMPKKKKENEKERDAGVMAPPKVIPKKVKPKGKENSDINEGKAVKRSLSENGLNAKKAKVVNDKDKNVNNDSNKDKASKINARESVKSQASVAVSKEDVNQKNNNNVLNKVDARKELTKNPNNVVINNKKSAKAKQATKNNVDIEKNSKDTEIVKSNNNNKIKQLNTAKNINVTKKVVAKPKNLASPENVGVESGNIVKNAESNKNKVVKKSNTDEVNPKSNVQKVNKDDGPPTVKVKNATDKVAANKKDTVSNDKAANVFSSKNQETLSKNVDNPTPTENGNIIKPKSARSVENTQKTKEKCLGKHNIVNKDSNIAKNKPKEKKSAEVKQSTLPAQISQNTDKNQLKPVNTIENGSKATKPIKNIVNPPNQNSSTKPQMTTEKTSKTSNVASAKVKENIIDIAHVKKKTSKPAISKADDNLKNKFGVKNLSHKVPLKSKAIYNKPQDAIRNNSDSKTKSKIPQKKSQSPVKKNPLRISPRKFPSTFKSPSNGVNKLKNLQKIATNIPRLMKKPVPNIK